MAFKEFKNKAFVLQLKTKISKLEQDLEEIRKETDKEKEGIRLQLKEKQVEIELLTDEG